MRLPNLRITMDSIFKKEDFSLCVVPVPKGYPQSQTHAGVAFYDNTVILTSSPFPSIIRSRGTLYVRAMLKRLSMGKLCNNVRGEVYENPCIYSSTDGINFRLMQKRPLMETPDPYYGLPAYNSDPDLFVEGKDIYVLNRVIYRTKLTPERKHDDYEIRIFLIKGVLDEGRFKYYSTTLLKETTDLIVSPCITKYRGRYLYMSLWTNCYNDGVSFEGLRFVSADTVDGLVKKENWSSVEVIMDKWIPWHMSVFSYKDRLFSIVACVEKGHPHKCWQMLGEFSDDLTKMTIYTNPLTDYNSYRGAAYVDENGNFVLYTTTVGERIKGGKSCDGREVLMAKMNFESLLKRVSEE